MGYCAGTPPRAGSRLRGDASEFHPSPAPAERGGGGSGGGGSRSDRPSARPTTDRESEPDRSAAQPSKRSKRSEPEEGGNNQRGPPRDTSREAPRDATREASRFKAEMGGVSDATRDRSSADGRRPSQPDRQSDQGMGHHKADAMAAAAGIKTEVRQGRESNRELSRDTDSQGLGRSSEGTVRRDSSRDRQGVNSERPPVKAERAPLKTERAPVKAERGSGADVPQGSDDAAGRHGKRPRTESAPANANRSESRPAAAEPRVLDPSRDSEREPRRVLSPAAAATGPSRREEGGKSLSEGKDTSKSTGRKGGREPIVFAPSKVSASRESDLATAPKRKRDLAEPLPAQVRYLISCKSQSQAEKYLRIQSHTQTCEYPP